MITLSLFLIKNNKKLNKIRGDIVTISKGSRHTFTFKKDGILVAVGSNNFTQYDVNSLII